MAKIQVDNPASSTSVLHYGEFYDTTTQTTGGTTTDNTVTFNTTDVASGISVGTGANAGSLTVGYTGAYLLNIFANLFLNGGGGGTVFTLWYAVNGTPATNSAFEYTASTSGQYYNGAMEDIALLNAGDVVTIHWHATTNTFPQLKALAAGTNPTRPAAPSIKLSIYNVG